MDISIIVPLYNEAESLPKLNEWIARVMKENGFSYEVIYVNDGSTDESWKVIEKLQRDEVQSTKEEGHVHGICFRRNYGKSAALYCGFKAAQGDVVITMDADLQDSPDEIPALYHMIKEEGYDLVSGWKQKRYDNKLTKNPVQALQRYGAQSDRHSVARHELRTESLPSGGSEEHRGLQRDAPLYPVSG